MTLALMLYPQLGLSYPLAYRCDENHKVSFDMNPEEISKIDKKRSPTRKDSLACEKEINQNKILFGLQLKLDIDGSSVSEKSQSFFQQMRKQDAKKLIGFRNHFYIYYPFHNNYSYITGCKNPYLSNCTAEVYDYGKEFEISTANSIERFKEIIKISLIADLDPYVAMAISFMEEPPSSNHKHSGIFLDPIGKFAALGCSHRLVKKSKNSVNSFDTFYQIPSQIVQNKKFIHMLEKVIKFEGRTISPQPAGKSYYCKSIKKKSEAGMNYGTSISKVPVDGECCLEIPYGKQELESVSHLLDDASIANFLKEEIINDGRFRSKGPEFLIQKFNGFSDLMGAAEGTDSWRLGTNFFQDPNYGYQAMDFIMNSFLNNPVITSLINEGVAQLEEKGLNSSYSSVLCIDKQPGVYGIDTEYYFKKTADTPRMQSLYEHYKNGGSFIDLSDRQKNVFRQEIYKLRAYFPIFDSIIQDEIGEDKALEEVDVTPESEKKMKAEFDKLIESSGVFQKYFSTIYESRKTLSLASTHQSSYRWERMHDDEIKKIRRQLSIKQMVAPVPIQGWNHSF